MPCSGGKDSCFNMMLCQQYGHEVRIGNSAARSMHLRLHMRNRTV